MMTANGTNEVSAPSKGVPSSTTPSQRFEDFAGYTTLHGLHFIFESHSNIRRLTWLVLKLLGFGFCIQQLIVSYGKLASNDHVISKEEIHSHKLTFPAITICNLNMMQKSKIKGTDAQVYLDQLNVFKQTFQKGQFKQRALNSSFDIKEAVDKYGDKPVDMIRLCAWNGTYCSRLNFTTHYSYLYGLCNTFNSGQSGHRLIYSTSIQEIHGFSLVVGVEQYKYYGMSSYKKAGVRIFLHDQNEWPNIEANGIDVMPGKTTSVRFKKTQVERLKPPFRSACGSRKLETSNVYTRSVCLHEHQTRATIQRCGCKLLGMPELQGYEGTKHCTPKQMTECGLYTKLDVDNNTDVNSSDKSTLSIITSGFIFNPNEVDSDCPVSCTEIEYQITRISVSDFLSESFWIDSMVLMDGKNPENMTSAEKEKMRQQATDFNGLTYLAVHYDDLKTYLTREKESYDINDFGASVGGNIGLFLGCSVLTVFEFIDFIIVACCGRRRNAKKYSMSEKIHENGINDLPV